jgi:formylglycine-generating enzyme required for sulfatase activity
LRVQALVGALIVGLVALAAWRNEQWLKDQTFWFANVRGYVHTTAQVLALPPKEPFQDCADCPEMVVVPAGEFMMGSPNEEKGHRGEEEPRHRVTIPKPFAVSRFELTFAEWDVCAAQGDCYGSISGGEGRGPQPVRNVSFDDAQRYVAWLSRVTGQSYHLLSEAEWEYSARAGSDKAYSWGDEIGKGNANCTECGNERNGNPIAPVGSFKPNNFGLYDMHGNVDEWVLDCLPASYDGAPTDGTARINEDCSVRAVRGGSWLSHPEELRSANRFGGPTYLRNSWRGFRVGRTLLTP